MRVGRFATVADPSREPEEVPGFGQLLLRDLFPAADQSEDRIALDRVRALAHSAAFLMMVHAVGATLVLLTAFRDGLDGQALMAMMLFAILLLFDAGLWYVTRRHRTWQLGPAKVVRLAAIYCALAAWVLALIVHPSMIAAGEDGIVQMALAACFILSIPAFLFSPFLVLETYVLALLQMGLLGMPGHVLGAIAAFGGCLLWFSLVEARASIMAARRRLGAEWQAQKAKRFVAEFEQSGHGWFWETNADGALTYVSDQLALDLKRNAADLIGRRFTDLVLVDESEAGDGAERTLAFHLGARFPFSNVPVRGRADETDEEECWWGVSGTPYFDDYGKFLGFRGIGTDLTEQMREEAEISKMARTDSLTGLPNRAMMRQMLEEALRNGARRKKGCALFLIDLDRFKAVNDTLGHPVGDQLLKQVAERLTAAIGEHGQVGRLGGDEFQAVFPGINEEGLLASIARRIVDQLAQPFLIEGNVVSIGGSVGIAIAAPAGSCAEALTRDADLALYASKAAGRGTWNFFRAEMQSEAIDRQILENDLKGALGRGELSLVYQPIVNAVTEEVIAFEALLRWMHPHRGPIAPADFVPLAEECGAIAGIGDWVLRSACAEAAKWPDHVRVAVNLSPLQFAQAGLPAVILGAVQNAGIAPERLELEVTEQVFVRGDAATDEIFPRLKALGVRLALDDFGIGYASLDYIRRAPFDKIKIDRSFLLAAGGEGRRNAAIVRSIVALAESLDMETTAEGAETRDELDLVRQLGCSEVQGFIFGRPMPADDAAAIAAQSARAESDAPGFSRAPRHRLIRTASLEFEQGAVEVRLRNISTGGALVECPRGLAPGSQARLAIPGCAPAEAEVRWSDAGRIGLRFNEPFDLRTLGPGRSPRSAVSMLKPDYLRSEGDPDSPWAGRRDRLTPKDARRF